MLTGRSLCFALLVWIGTCLGAVPGAAAPPALVADCGGVFNLCGFRAGPGGAEVIPRRFEHVFQFSEGLAAVRVKGQYGFINDKGDMVIAPQFDLAGAFYLGLAEVLIGNKTGVIDQQGKFVVTPRFARSVPFTNDVVLVREGIWFNNYIRGREPI
jgi:WG containing repeat